MQVVVAQPKDFLCWLELAAEVECLFGPLVDSPDFRKQLRKNIARGTAFCIRHEDGPPGTPLLGALLFSPKPPLYTIGWLAVAKRGQRQGLGRLLAEHVIGLVRRPAEVITTTFGPDAEGGEPARQFYEALGFRPGEMVASGPDGHLCQIYRRQFP